MFSAQKTVWKMCTESRYISKMFHVFFWFADVNLDTFRRISWDSVQILENWCLHWDRELKLVIFITMTLINGKKHFFSYKGAYMILKQKSIQLKCQKSYFFHWILVKYIKYLNNPHHHISNCHFPFFNPPSRTTTTSQLWETWSWPKRITTSTLTTTTIKTSISKLIIRIE